MKDAKLLPGVTRDRIRRSDLLTTISPGRERLRNDGPDAGLDKLAMEIGYAVLFSKPILVLASPGRTPPYGLVRAADQVVHLTAEPDGDVSQAQVDRAVRAFRRSIHR